MTHSDTSTKTLSVILSSEHLAALADLIAEGIDAKEERLTCEPDYTAEDAADLRTQTEVGNDALSRLQAAFNNQ